MDRAEEGVHADFPVVMVVVPGKVATYIPFEVAASLRDECLNVNWFLSLEDARGKIIMGPEVSALEKEMKPVVGCQYPIACASGSDALLLALMALDIGPGDEVITVPFTFVAMAGCIARLGARPVFIDIDPHSYNPDPAQLDRAITKHTKSIIPIHLFGLPADMDPILEIAARQNIPVIEDAAQAIGAKYIILIVS